VSIKAGEQKELLSIKKHNMPLSYVIYGSAGLVIITILIFLFSKKKNR